jgi:hypothetical protein
LREQTPGDGDDPRGLFFLLGAVIIHNPILPNGR